MLARIKETDLSVPYREGGYFYYSRTEEGKQYPIYCRQSRVRSTPPRRWSSTSTRSPRGSRSWRSAPTTVSDDGHLLAYSARQHRLPRVHAVREGPAHRRAPAANRSRARVGGLGADDQTLFYTVEDERQAAVPAVPPCARHRRPTTLVLRGEGRAVPRRRGPHAQPRVLFLVLPAATPPAECALPRRGDAAPASSGWSAPRSTSTSTTSTITASASTSAPTTAAATSAWSRRRSRLPAARHWKEVVPHRPDVMLEGIEFFAGFYVAAGARGRPAARCASPTSRTGKCAPHGVPRAGLLGVPGRQPRVRHQRCFRYSLPVARDAELGLRLRHATRAARRCSSSTEVLGRLRPREVRVASASSRRAPDGVQVPVSLVYRSDLRATAAHAAAALRLRLVRLPAAGRPSPPTG